MKLQNVRTAYTFDDVILIPKYSEVISRSHPDITTVLGGIHFPVPIFSSPMNTVTEAEMIRSMIDSGGSGVLHRFMPIDVQANIVQELFFENYKEFYATIGAAGDYKERLHALVEAGIAANTCVNICVDIAHGDSLLACDAVKYVKQYLLQRSMYSSIMAGNVCTFEGAYNLATAGADVIKVGIGPGAMCKTRVVTGHGLPQLTAIDDCSRIKLINPAIKLIADGGIRNTGDMVKALAAGADAVMLGSMLAGTDEAPGEVMQLGGLQYKMYAGMASNDGRRKWFKENNLPAEEGESTMVRLKGPVSNLMEEYKKGIKAGLTYSGARNLSDLRKNAEFAVVTANGYREGTPHGK